MVSVIIPTYNAEKTIVKCIESVINQTYKDIEIICCDDCSTDDTVKILEDLKRTYKLITILQNEKNSRAAFSRNRCIEASKGEYIAQLDDDDYMESDRIEKQINFLKNNPEYAFVGSNMIYFNELGPWKKTDLKKQPIKSDFLTGSQFGNPSVTFRKDCLIAVSGYRVAKETVRGQDYDLFMRLYAEGFKGYNMKECLTYYYRGKSGYKKTNFKIRYYDFIVRWKNFKKLGLFPVGIFYSLKPLILGLIPFGLLEKIKYYAENKRN